MGGGEGSAETGSRVPYYRRLKRGKVSITLITLRALASCIWSRGKKTGPRMGVFLIDYITLFCNVVLNKCSRSTVVVAWVCWETTTSINRLVSGKSLVQL